MYSSKMNIYRCLINYCNEILNLNSMGRHESVSNNLIGIELLLEDM